MSRVVGLVLVMMLVLLTGTFSARAQEQPPRQSAATLETQVPVRLNYLIAFPKDYDSRESWPLLLFLHGSGERGDDLQRVKVHGPPKLIEQGKEFPMIVVSPQCPANRRWEPIELLALIDDLIARHKVNPDQVYVTGLSMGGFGTWALAAYAPERLAAIVPICGGGEAYWTRAFAHLPVWAFHGAKDRAVPVERTETMIEALKRNGGTPRVTIYPEAEHDSWTETYNNPELYEWLLSQRRRKADET